jgi:hypothetical protein
MIKMFTVYLTSKIDGESVFSHIINDDNDFVPGEDFMAFSDTDGVTHNYNVNFVLKVVFQEVEK